MPSAGKKIRHLWQRPEQQTEINTSLFSQLRSAGAIGALAPFTLHSNKDVASAALQQIKHLLNKQFSANINWVDETIRAMFYFCQGRDWAQGWQKANGSTISNLPLEGWELVTALTLLACHNNGFARMQALRRLALLDIEVALKLAFVRANDWVNPVSQAALDIINECLPQLQERQLVQYLHLIDQLQHKKRRNLEPIRLLVKQQLNTEAGYRALASAACGNDYRSARLAFQLLAENTDDLRALLKISIQSKDIVIRSKSIELIEKLSDHQEQVVLLGKLAGDTYSPIAKRALHVLAERYLSRSETLLVENLLHPNKGVREICRFYLKRSSEVNFLKIYANQIAATNPTIQAAAILGLSEIGGSNQWALIEGIHSKRPRVAGAIIRAAANLGCMPNSWFEEKVITGTPTEAREASDALSQNEDYLPQHARTLLKQGLDTSRIRYVLNVARRKDKWGHLGVLLAAFIQVNGAEEHGLEGKLKSWLKRHFQHYWYVKPSQSVLNDLLTQIESAKSINNIELLRPLERFVRQVDESDV